MTSDNPKSIYWDSSCFIAFFSEETERFDICNAVVDAARKGDLKLHTSYLTLAEVVRIPDEYPTEADNKIQEFFRNPYIIKISVDEPVTRIARDLRRKYKLRVSDAIHLATAIYMKVDVLHTYDKDDLLKLNNNIEGWPLSITKPSFNFQIEFNTE